MVCKHMYLNQKKLCHASEQEEDFANSHGPKALVSLTWLCHVTNTRSVRSSPTYIFIHSILGFPQDPVLGEKQRGPERWLSSLEHQLLSQHTQGSIPSTTRNNCLLAPGPGHLIPSSGFHGHCMSPLHIHEGKHTYLF